MFSTSRHAVVIAFLVIAPAPAMAQSGPVTFSNSTGEYIRIGCDHYIDASGLRVDLNAFWDLRPGVTNTKLLFNGSPVVAKKFVFFIITPGGESVWNYDKLTYGELWIAISTSTLAQHKKTAVMNLTPRYPPLTPEAIQAAALKAEIARLQDLVARLDIAIPLAQIAVDVAKQKANDVNNDPNASLGDKLFYVGLAIAAQATLDQLIAQRQRAQVALGRPW